ncbi:MAG: hypothetical protein WCK82_09475 [Bacteroidota bacterium]
MDAGRTDQSAIVACQGIDVATGGADIGLDRTYGPACGHITGWSGNPHHASRGGGVTQKDFAACGQGRSAVRRRHNTAVADRFREQDDIAIIGTDLAQVVHLDIDVPGIRAKKQHAPFEKTVSVYGERRCNKTAAGGDDAGFADNHPLRIDEINRAGGAHRAKYAGEIAPNDAVERCALAVFKCNLIAGTNVERLPINDAL